MVQPLDYKKVSLEEARKVLDEDVNAAAEQQTWSGKRSSAGDATLLDTTAAWLAGLPESARPVELAQRYPRIANELCRLWRQPARWERYMAELLIVRSAARTRRGFPPRVASELAALAAYQTKAFPAAPQATGRPFR